MPDAGFKVFAGTAHPALARAVAAALRTELGACEVQRFPDGEVGVELREPVRHAWVFLVQPTPPPVDPHLLELLALADACRRASAAHVTAVVPYLGYARGDKRDGRRQAITASIVARLLEVAGISHLMTLDLHAPQIEGFFHIPVDVLTACGLLTDALVGRLAPETAVVSPDAGRVPLATCYAERLGLPLVLLHKRRESGSETHVTHVVGNVEDRPCLIIDDMISTGGTMERAVRAVLAAGARPDVTIAATHGLLLAEARRRLAIPEVREVVVTDTVPPPAGWPALRVVPVAPLLATAALRMLAARAVPARV